MAEEVGAAFVSLIPSARGFSKLAQRELNAELRGNRTPTIRVTPKVDADTARAEITAELTGVGQQVTVPVDVEVDEQQTRNHLVRTFTGIARTEHLTVDADVDDAELLRDTRRAVAIAEAGAGDIDVEIDVDPERGRFLGSLLGGAIGSGIEASGGAIQEGILAPLKGLAANPIVGTIGAILGVAIAAAAAGAIAAALTGGLLLAAGAGVIGLGAFILKDDPAVKGAAAELVGTIKAAFAGAAQPLVKPFVESLGILRDLVIELSPQLRDMFAAVGPSIIPLTKGFADFVRGVMPGFLALVKQSGPFLTQLAWSLGGLGKNLGAFLGIVASGGPGASTFFRDLIRLIGGLLKVLGILIRLGVAWYTTTRTILVGSLAVWRMAYQGISGAITGLIGFFGKIPGAVSRVWSRVREETGRAVAFMRGVPRRLVNALGNLGRLLYEAGRNVIQGLIDGIKSKFPDLGGAIGRAAGLIRNHLPFSPAKVGPLSGRGAPFRSGQAIVRDLAAGMDRALPAVASASSQLGATVTANARGGASAAQASPQLSWADGATGDQLLDALRELIRIRYDGVPDNALAS